MAIWKWGIHFGGRQSPSHYKFIKDEGIVIGHLPDTRYEPDDLVIINDGFTVKAIVRVDESPQPITNFPNYAFVQEEYNITFASYTIVAKAEWYDYPFWYELVMSGNQVHDAERIRVVQNIWDNR